MNIKVYSTQTCPYCHMAKDYFKAKNIPFTDIDVSSDAQGLEDMRKISGQMGVPVIVIDNEVIVGFNRTKIDSLTSK